MKQGPKGLAVGLAFLFQFIFIATAFAAPVSSRDLLESGSKYQGQLIEYEGEVVGDLMQRGEYAWVPISDGLNTIGVWAPSSCAKKIKYIGSYRYRGDRVRVSGIFHDICRDHGGDLDIHAKRLDIIERGRRIFYPLELSRFVGVGILGLFALLLYLLNHFRMRGPS